MSKTEQDSRLIPLSDYQAVLKEVAELKAAFETEKERKEKYIRENSALKKQLGKESRPIESVSEPDSGPKPIENQPSKNITTAAPLETTATKENQSADDHNDPKSFRYHGFTQTKYCPYGQCETDQQALNPGWVDETQCKDCGFHMGPISDIFDPKNNPSGTKVRCPGCGGKEVKDIRNKKQSDSFLKSLMIQ